MDRNQCRITCPYCGELLRNTLYSHMLNEHGIRLLTKCPCGWESGDAGDKCSWVSKMYLHWATANQDHAMVVLMLQAIRNGGAP